MTGEKTSLENQILGTYKEIEEDIWMIASVRSPEKIKTNKSFISEEKRQVLEAIQNRRFNRDDIDEFLRVGAIGENNEGYLTYFGNERTQRDSRYKQIVIDIMNEENRDRRILMERVISVDPNLTMEDMPEVEKIFADQNRQQANIGDRIQLEDGEWIIKTKEE
jgi:uncharacterized protein YdbL (DUF1318 family)